MRALFHPRRRPNRWFVPAGLALVLAPSALRAQMHHVDAPERVTRAIGVYEWTGDLNKPTAARFVPVSLFINGAMQDAGLYLARPVPFALQTGDLYSLEHAGEPQGLLDLDYAQRAVTNEAVKDDDSVAAWYGFGKFTPQVPPKTANLHPSTRLPVIQADGKTPASADDSRPHMSRRGDSTTPAPTGGDSEAKNPAAKPNADNTSSSGGKAAGSTGSGSTTASSDDTDRPTLRHRDPSQDASRKREYGTRSKQASVISVGPGPGDDPDRPVLGRNTEADAGTPPLTGLPADMHQTIGVSDPVHRDDHNFAREWDTPSERTLTLSSLVAAARPCVMAYLAKNSLVPSSDPLPQEQASAVAASVPAATSSRASAQPVANTEDTQNTDEPAAPPKLQRGVPSQYQPSEPSGTAAKATPATTAAPTTVTATTMPPAKTPPRSTPSTTNRSSTHLASRTVKSSPAELTFAQSSLTGYTLSYGGLPTFVYTAAASVAPSRAAPLKPASSNSAVAAGAGVPAPPPAGASAHRAVFVTVVAQRLPSGELQVVLSSVTDSLHLDRSPRLRLVDAVDPDDSHRASLLFELRGASSRQFALYRLTAAQAEQTFTTASIE